MDAIQGALGPKISPAGRWWNDWLSVTIPHQKSACRKFRRSELKGPKGFQAGNVVRAAQLSPTSSQTLSDVWRGFFYFAEVV
jgi:hypothetical protein